MLYDEQVTPFSVTGPGNFDLTRFASIDVLEVLVQVTDATDLQFLEGDTPISGQYSFQANDFWSWPGKRVQGILRLEVQSAAIAKGEVRWRRVANK